MEARERLAGMVDEAVQEGQGREELLQKVLVRFIAELATLARGDAEARASGGREGMAASYRLSRRLAMGRAAIGMIPRNELSPSVRSGSLSSYQQQDPAFEEWFWAALTGPTRALYDADAALSQQAPS